VIIDTLGAGHGQASWSELVRVHLVGTDNLLKASRELRAPAACIVTSSSAVYGEPAVERVTEAQTMNSVSPYGLAKSMQEQLVAFASRMDLARMVLIRPFNLIGPGIPEALVAGRIARQLALMELGRQAPVLQTGGLAAYRDFVDVRDVAAALLAVAVAGQRGVAYNVYAGAAVRVGALVECFLHSAHAPVVKVESTEGFGVYDVARQCGDYSRLRADTGWLPRIPLMVSVEDTLTQWREELS
jgi:GDP-4-dehydro-6-deoxy-D-mannose reductase